MNYVNRIDGILKVYSLGSFLGTILKGYRFKYTINISIIALIERIDRFSDWYTIRSILKVYWYKGMGQVYQKRDE